MNNKQLLIGGIVFLFALNLFTIGFMLWDKKQSHDKKCISHFQPKKGCSIHSSKQHNCGPASGGCASFHAKDRKHPEEEMAKILNLSDEQKMIMKEERKEHFLKIKELKTEKRVIKKNLFSLLEEDKIDSTRMNVLLDKIAVNERSEKEELMRHFIAIKKNLTADQLIQFEKMIQKMNRHFNKRDSIKN